MILENIQTLLEIGIKARWGKLNSLQKGAIVGLGGIGSAAGLSAINDKSETSGINGWAKKEAQSAREEGNIKSLARLARTDNHIDSARKTIGNKISKNIRTLQYRYRDRFFNEPDGNRQKL